MQNQTTTSNFFCIFDWTKWTGLIYAFFCHLTFLWFLGQQASKWKIKSISSGKNISKLQIYIFCHIKFCHNISNQPGAGPRKMVKKMNRKGAGNSFNILSFYFQTILITQWVETFCWGAYFRGFWWQLMYISNFRTKHAGLDF